MPELLAAACLTGLALALTAAYRIGRSDAHYEAFRLCLSMLRVVSRARDVVEGADLSELRKALDDYDAKRLLR